MSDCFDYGGEVAEVVSKFKAATVGSRNARLFGLLRLGTFQETFKGELKQAAPQAVAIFHLLGKEDKMDDGSAMFFTKPFPLKKGDKSFLHSKFIPAFGGMAKHKGFGTMTNCMFSLKLKGGKEKNEDGTPKYVNFDSMAEISEDMLEMAEQMPQFAALENPVGFLTEGELTKEALEMLHPTREFAGILMKTQEYLAGTHPSQSLIEEIYNADKERYTIKAKDKKEEEENQEAGQESANGAQQLPSTPEDLGDNEQEF
ncbi:hypothetical protein PV_036 (endogenous virus) [Gutovirus Vc1]|uniref:Uncharacterized protein n=1 Tax=Vibrio phage Vc1 TaxID=1480731 RepID=X2KPM5_9CAUD|nr:hypothetical protein HOQ97_gp36 [Vibrio phage Vc1]AHN84687.1 hypothetical protein PV_036 [Vibrio phage Vc1]